ncbi:MAG TPA: S9 family peptidase [Dyella sp.]|uniref:S9 family peptidase n=1 Tax=Dyella sp. TaxID=1869338 RepID=UPI002D797119|nr:S9 family peptidase [Dyella sp.]HET6553125.1 S9 family peptidase [Dyella sp.]
MRRLLLLLALLAGPAFAEDGTRFVPADINRLADVSEPAISRDGQFVVYTVATANLERDQPQSDLWRVRFDGSGRTQLTHTPDSSEWHAQWTSDGKAIAFLSDRKLDGEADDDDTHTQVWMMPADGGEAHRVTNLPDGVDDFVLSPDGKRLAVIAYDPDRAPGAKKPKNPPPVVTDRFQFKDDDKGWLDGRHKHLYIVDVATGRAGQLTSGRHDEQLPAWSPDGSTIAYVTKRGADPDRHLNYDIYLIAPKAGAPERQLTTFPGSDLDPYWETRPAWSPDSQRIAYLQSGEDKWIYYAPWQLAVIDVATGKATLPAPIDRCFTKPHWSPDGRSVYALVEQAEVTHLSRIDIASGRITALTTGKRFDADLDVSANDRVVVLGGDDTHPYDVSAVEKSTLRALSEHNAWLTGKQLATTEELQFNDADGVSIHALLVKPVGYVAGRRYPTIVRVHGGPVYQFSHEFMADWQTYAAHGYAVLAVNPRGSSGRGFDFARAIYADWGAKDSQDVLAGVDQLVQRGIADPDRLGVGGWSYGAILTDEIIARDTRFKAAISGAGTGNAYGMYGDDEYAREYELELGTPWANRAAWDRASYPFLHADRIRTPTLFQCGERDFNVPCIGAEQMYQALRSLGITTGLVMYPGQHHGLTVPSYLRDRLERNLAWYDRFLQREPTP